MNDFVQRLLPLHKCNIPALTKKKRNLCEIPTPDLPSIYLQRKLLTPSNQALKHERRIITLLHRLQTLDILLSVGSKHLLVMIRVVHHAIYISIYFMNT